MTWLEAANKILGENKAWREANPEAWEEQQAYLAERRYKESQARRRCDDTHESYKEERDLFKAGY